MCTIMSLQSILLNISREGFPINQQQKEEINIFITSNPFYTLEERSNTLLKCVVIENYALLKSIAVDVCFRRNAGFIIEPIHRYTATCLLSLYYRYRKKIDKSVFYSTLHTYLCANRANPVLKTNNSEANHPKNLIDIIDHWLAKIDNILKLDKYLPRCIRLCKLVYNFRYFNYKRQEFYRACNNLIGKLLDLCKKHQWWNEYSTIAAFVLNVKDDTYILDVFNELVTNLRFISEEKLAELPYYLAKHETINMVSSFHVVYEILIDANSNRLNDVETYTLRLCIFMWNRCEEANDHHCYEELNILLESMTTKQNSPLFLLLCLFTNCDNINKYETQMQTYNPSRHLFIDYSERYYSKLSSMWKHVLGNEGERCIVLQNLETIFNYIPILSKKLPGEDIDVFLFWYLLKCTNVCPTLFPIGRLLKSSIIDKIDIHIDYGISDAELSLVIWQNIYNKIHYNSTKVLNSVPSFRGLDKIGLRYFVEILTKIQHLKCNIINSEGGLDYLSSKNDFENQINKLPLTQIDIQSTMLKQLFDYLDPKSVASPRLSGLTDIQHMMFRCLLRLGDREYEYKIIPAKLDKYFSGICVLIDEFKSFSKRDDFSDTCCFYHPVKGPWPNFCITTFYKAVLAKTCYFLADYEGLLQLLPLFQQLNVDKYFPRGDIRKRQEEIGQYVHQKAKILVDLSKMVPISYTIDPYLTKLKKLIQTLYIKKYNNSWQFSSKYDICGEYEDLLLKLIRLEPPTILPSKSSDPFNKSVNLIKV